MRGQDGAVYQVQSVQKGEQRVWGCQVLWQKKGREQTALLEAVAEQRAEMEMRKPPLALKVLGPLALEQTALEQQVLEQQALEQTALMQQAPEQTALEPQAPEQTALEPQALEQTA